MKSTDYTDRNPLPITYHLSPIIIGLTGGIACGKSAVVNEFKKLGAKVIDADKIAHQVLHENLEVKNKIIKNFGKEILKKDGEINRKKLGKTVFANKNKLSLLNRIIHPPIITEIKKQIRALSTCQLINLSTVVVLDAPLLFEAKITNLVDKILVVAVPQEIQLKRLMERNNLTEQEARERINSQWNIEKKKKFADFIIDNTKPLPMVEKQIYQIWKSLPRSCTQAPLLRGGAGQGRGLLSSSQRISRSLRRK